MVKKILSILAWIVTGVALAALFFAARNYYLKQPLTSVRVNIDRAADSGFVKKGEVHSCIGQLCASTPIGKVNMVEIDDQLRINPWVEHASSFIDLDGTLNISLKEYEPMLRVFGKNGQSAYLTSGGIVLPTSDGYTPHVLIASGNFSLDSVNAHRLCDTVEADRNLINAMKVCNAIKGNEFMRSCIGQIYCNGRNEFEVVARNIDARIIVGDTCNLDDKLLRLEIFIKQKINSHEIRKLKTINLKYKNQIVCTKK